MYAVLRAVNADGSRDTIGRFGRQRRVFVAIGRGQGPVMPLPGTAGHVSAADLELAVGGRERVGLEGVRRGCA